MAEITKSVASDMNEDIREDEKPVVAQPEVSEIQTAVEENPVEESAKINPDGQSMTDTAVIADAEKVEPVVTIEPTTQKPAESDYRLANKYGAKTAEGETDLNSDLQYQSLFGMPTK